MKCLLILCLCVWICFGSPLAGGKDFLKEGNNHEKRILISHPLNKAENSPNEANNLEKTIPIEWLLTTDSLVKQKDLLKESNNLEKKIAIERVWTTNLLVNRNDSPQKINNLEKKIPVEKIDTIGAEDKDILVTQGFFAIKQSDGRWLTEVYSTDKHRGTRILYSAVTPDIPTKAPPGLEEYWDLFNGFQKNIKIPSEQTILLLNSLFDQ